MRLAGGNLLFEGQGAADGCTARFADRSQIGGLSPRYTESTSLPE